MGPGSGPDVWGLGRWVLAFGLQVVRLGLCLRFLIQVSGFVGHRAL